MRISYRRLVRGSFLKKGLEQVDFRDTPVVTMQRQNKPLALSRKHLGVPAVRHDRCERSAADNYGNFGSRTERKKWAVHGDEQKDLLAVCLRNSLWAVEALCCVGCTHWIDGWFLYDLKHLNAKAKDRLKKDSRFALTSGKYKRSSWQGGRIKRISRCGKGDMKKQNKKRRINKVPKPTARSRNWGSWLQFSAPCMQEKNQTWRWASLWWMSVSV